MKMITTKESKKWSPEFGWLKVIEFKIFGFKFWTEHHGIEVSDNAEEIAISQIMAERQVSFSEMSANLPELSNEKFNSFQKEIYPTRF